MRLPPIAAASLLVLCVPAALVAQTVDTLPRFPAVTGHSLQGHDVTLPAGFTGERNLVFVAFRRDQQRDVDSWRPLARELVARDSTVRAYEIPVLARRYRFVRPMMEAGMRRGMPDTTTRAHTILLFIDKSPFERALRISSEDAIVPMIVDRDGRVRWRARGPFTAVLADSLRAALALP